MTTGNDTKFCIRRSCYKKARKDQDFCTTDWFKLPTSLRINLARKRKGSTNSALRYLSRGSQEAEEDERSIG